MDMNDQLLQRYFKHLTTESENDAVQKYLASLSYKDYERIVNQYQQHGQQPSKVLSSERKSAILTQILSTKKQHSNGHSSFKIFISVAASLFLVFTSLYVIQRQQKNTQDSISIASIQKNHPIVIVSDDNINQINESAALDYARLPKSEKATNGVQKIVVPDGKLLDVVLPDGTAVKMNGGSTIEFPLEFGKERIISFSGEAYFNVAKITATFYY